METSSALTRAPAFTVTLGGIWESYSERFGELVMYCCRRPVGYVREAKFPYGHVYILRFKGYSDDGTLDNSGEIIEHYRLQEDAPLELNAIAHAMREKYTP